MSCRRYVEDAQKVVYRGQLSGPVTEPSECSSCNNITVMANLIIASTKRTETSHAAAPVTPCCIARLSPPWRSASRL